MHRTQSNIIAPLLLGALMTISACGYSFSGRGLVVPKDARTIAILTFLNGTNEPNVDVELTNAVVSEFIADGRLRVVDREEADLVLKGTVATFEVIPLSYTTDAYAQQYQIRLRVRVGLTDRSGKVIQPEQVIESGLISSYTVTIGDISATKAAKQVALQNASKDFAKTIRSRILEGF